MAFLAVNGTTSPQIEVSLDWQNDPTLNTTTLTDITPSEAARLLGVSYKTINRRIDSGELRGIRTPLGRLVDADAVLGEVERRRYSINGRCRSALVLQLAAGGNGFLADALDDRVLVQDPKSGNATVDLTRGGPCVVPE
jgi:excisionase family DNA binding protein